MPNVYCLLSTYRHQLGTVLGAVEPDLVGLGLLAEKAVLHLAGREHAGELAGIARMEKLGALGELGIGVQPEEDKDHQHERARHEFLASSRITSSSGHSISGGRAQRCGVCHVSGIFAVDFPL